MKRKNKNFINIFSFLLLLIFAIQNIPAKASFFTQGTFFDSQNKTPQSILNSLFPANDKKLYQLILTHGINALSYIPSSVYYSSWDRSYSKFELSTLDNQIILDKRNYKTVMHVLNSILRKLRDQWNKQEIKSEEELDLAFQSMLTHAHNISSDTVQILLQQYINHKKTLIAYEEFQKKLSTKTYELRSTYPLLSQDARWIEKKISHFVNKSLNEIYHYPTNPHPKNLQSRMTTLTQKINLLLYRIASIAYHPLLALKNILASSKKTYQISPDIALMGLQIALKKTVIDLTKKKQKHIDDQYNLTLIREARKFGYFEPLEQKDNITLSSQDFSTVMQKGANHVFHYFQNYLRYSRWPKKVIHDFWAQKNLEINDWSGLTKSFLKDIFGELILNSSDTLKITAKVSAQNSSISKEFNQFIENFEQDWQNLTQLESEKNHTPLFFKLSSKDLCSRYLQLH